MPRSCGKPRRATVPGRRGGAQQQQVHRAAQERDEAASRRPPRTICLWARIDKWENDARIFEYGRKAPQGELFGLRTWDTPGSFAILEQHPKGAYTNVTVNLTDTDRLVAQRPSARPTGDSAYGSYSYSHADSSSAKSPSYGGSYSAATRTRRDRRLTFDSDSGSPPWHRLWEKTWHHYCVTYAAVPKEKDRPKT